VTVPADDARSGLDLPRSVQGCLFDLDGVLTRTATAHAAAWAAMFNEFLATRPSNASTVPFGPDDYAQYLDGKPRLDGIRSFLASRSITVPEGSPGDTPGTATVHGLGNRKNALFLDEISHRGVEVFDGSVRFVRAVRDAGLRTALVSSSANAAQVLEAARITDLFDARIDGAVAQVEHLAGKPQPDIYIAGAHAIGLTPGHAAVFEDALAGVEAGRAGRFAYVVGVDRLHQRDALLAHGADVVVNDLADLLEDPR